MSDYFFTKQQKPIVSNWINQCFASNNVFPLSCSLKNNTVKCSIKAYKSWRNTPDKRKHIDAWVHDWLTTEEQNELVAHLAELDQLEI
jgi:hypothetical protein